jgi:hypothetical protein
MKKRLRGKLTYANVVSSLCLFLLLGGGAAVAAGIGKNSVGAKQLKKNSVTTVKVKNGAITEAKIAAGAVTETKIAKGAVTASKIADGSLTGAQIDASTLGTVPSAHIAGTANTASVAATANVANTAGIAKSLTPSEPWHVVGAPGEPKFSGSWYSSATSYGPVAFYKDQAGIVHLKGPAANSVSAFEIFRLPPGFRPEAGTFLALPVLCNCPEGRLEISGSNGEVEIGGGNFVHLEGVSFKAES